ncbi:MAG: hypothetical protein methR_P0476 [Methyloprofundus sp.]|nr:MAG: hypothetical protein methR_P0476 [Methyloprofundus sp.]
MSLIDLHLLHNELLTKAKSWDFQDIVLPENFRVAYEQYLSEYAPSGYHSIVWTRHSAKIRTSSGKFIYATNYWFYIASELAKFAKVLNEYKALFLDAYKGKDSNGLKEIATSFREGDKAFESNKVLNALTDKEKGYFHVFMSEYSQWGGGKTIDRNDFYVSPILKSGNLLAETQAGVAEIAYQLANNEGLWEHLRDKVSISRPIKIEQINKSWSGETIRVPKSFILLAGLSGTGKTRFVKQQAERFRQDASNYCIVPVRPDWHEPSDLLGYISRLGSHGTEYIVTDFLVFLVAAWKDITLSIIGDEVHYKENGVPYWLCLDEMNLAPVEQYFADYLAIIETRYWKDGQYYCDALLSAGVFRQVADVAGLRVKLNLEGEDDNALWEHFLAKGIGIPPNLIVAGTVNMDETTHGFSRKVIDRAFTLDFGEFFPNNYQTYFEPKTQAKTLSFSVLSQVDTAMIAAYDANGIKSIEFLEAVNAVLKESPFELAYRALNELLIAVVCFGPRNAIELQAVWDDFLMTKVLPRIEGDSEKLQDRDDGSLLDKLVAVLSDQFNEMWDVDNARPDLLREDIEGKVLKIPCRSKKKINWMQGRLSSNGFTSFWP